MGVNALWQLLRAEGVVESYRGAAPADHAAITAALDGTALAVDLAQWLVQADQQQALLQHFSQEDRCMKVAFERALQMLRHGCLPVIVVEGRPPEEKRAELQRRMAARTGGLPVFYAPGEAEATCAALCRASAVDGCATSDSDALLYGAEALYHTLKLSTAQPRDCEVTRVRMGTIRRRLGLQAGGARALAVLAALSGSDYDAGGAQGVGGSGGLALARALLQGDADDALVLERLAAAVERPPDEALLALTKCTGCKCCGHEGSRLSRIERHSKRNPCPCCPPSEDGHCREVAFDHCACAFHRLEAERRAERVLQRARERPSFLADAQAALAVFERQGAEADAYVRQRLGELGGQPGQKLQWLRRPSVQGAYGAIVAHRRQLLWDLLAVRSKLLPVLLEWDLQQQGAGVGGGQAEFEAAEIQKVHGLRSKSNEPTAAHWRYVVRWQRLEGDVEPLGPLEVRAKRPRAKPGSATAAGLDAEDAGMLPGEEGPPEVLTLAEFDARWMKEQPAEHRAVRISAVRRLAPALEARFQRQAGGAAAGSPAKKARGGGGGGGSKAAAGGGAAKPRAASQARAAAMAAAAAPAPMSRSEALMREFVGLADTERRSQLSPPAAAQRQQPQQAQQQQQQREQQEQADADLAHRFAQRKAALAAAGAAAATAAPAKRKPSAAAAAAAAGAGYGLAGSGPAAGQHRQQQQPQQPQPQHLPASAADMRTLLSRAVGPTAGRSTAGAAAAAAAARVDSPPRRVQRPPPEQQASPQKKARSPGAQAKAAADGAELRTPGNFEVLLSSPESPGYPQAWQAGTPSPPPLAQRMLEAGLRLQRAAELELLQGQQEQEPQREQPPAQQQRQEQQREQPQRPAGGRLPRRGPGSAGRSARPPGGTLGASPGGLAGGPAGAAGAAGATVDLTYSPPGAKAKQLPPAPPAAPAAAAARGRPASRQAQQAQRAQRQVAEASPIEIDLTGDSD